MKNKQQSAGICLGASTISLVIVETDAAGLNTPAAKITKVLSKAHEGRPQETMLDLIEQSDIDDSTRVVITGRKLKNAVNLTTIQEVEAVEYAYGAVKSETGGCSAIVSAGGETFMVYLLDEMGHISNVVTGNKCASGTGEFFLQQLKRMDVSINDIDAYMHDNPYDVSGRCSVFCKSDCTHATNSGIQKSRVTSGLCRMMAQKILELLKGTDKKNIMLTGGTTRIRQMIDYLDNEIDNLVIPDQAAYFEAFGCALYASGHQPLVFRKGSIFSTSGKNAFKSLPHLQSSADLVSFMSIPMTPIQADDTCILGLDVGSTTTKAILLREKDNAILFSVYLRTSGDPVNASIECYKAIYQQIKQKTDPDAIQIIGIGICGSGRRIAGIHAGSTGVINEITAHARAAVYFDPAVDTLFEIGGQDAKYTLISNGIPSDYAMNEACSAGTGSFLEESAKETLGVCLTDIAQRAVKSSAPPDFSDQCAAFIGSDIKTAVQSGTGSNDILAGLTYSVCQNYLNRVKGSRPVGKKIFMQGGVCYNKAVPLAMASLLKKPIIVPPHPGLMGAFGAALVIKEQIRNKMYSPDRFSLEKLIRRRVKHLAPFQCNDRSGSCDRGCMISLIEIDGKKIPFGGACDKYYNQNTDRQNKKPAANWVQQRQDLVFNPRPQPRSLSDSRPDPITIGLNKSFLVNTYYPFYYCFFSSLGFHVEVPERPDPDTSALIQAAFCYPAELAHGYFKSLLRKNTCLDYIFLPHLKAVPDIGTQGHSQLCPFAQAEPYYLNSTFKDDLTALKAYGTKLVTPVLDMTHGIDAVQKPMVRAAQEMGAAKNQAVRAFETAVEAQQSFMNRIKDIGSRFLSNLEKTPGEIGIVIFGRPYNSFSADANKNIPAKFASRGIRVIPFDCLPIESEKEKQGLYWGTGQQIYKGARFVKNHPQLFGVFITNFSCGPDSFILSYFRDVMDTKPSLTLELDSHTADAGIETRIEAFLDIIQMSAAAAVKRLPHINPFTPDQILQENGKFFYHSASQGMIALKDPDVELVIPSMGQFSSQAMAAVFKGLGYHARCHPPADDTILKLGISNTLNKECLPMTLVTGMLLNAVKNKPEDKKLAFFIATASGPCRLGQYEVYMKDLIKKRRIPDVAIFSLSSGASYSGLGKDFQKRMWIGTLVADAFEDMRSMIQVNASDKRAALSVLDEQWCNVLTGLEADSIRSLFSRFRSAADTLARIALKKPIDDIPVISLVGEIFVRRDSFSRRFLVQRLAELGFAVSCAPVAEWFFYIDLMLSKGYLKKKLSKIERLEAMYRKNFMLSHEREIQAIFKTTGLYKGHPVEIGKVIEQGTRYIGMDLGGEGILTVGSSLVNIAESACGVIAIGPFGCMPNRISESILSRAMTSHEKNNACRNNKHLSDILALQDHLPFLAIESDGRPFPQMIEAKLEPFLLRANRLHSLMLQKNGTAKPNRNSRRLIHRTLQLTSKYVSKNKN